MSDEPVFLSHDFNNPRVHDFHHVVVDKELEAVIHSGDIVEFGDKSEITSYGKVRCLIAVIEELEEWELPAGLSTERLSKV